MILLSDPLILGTPVAECAEPLVDLRHIRRLRVDDRLADSRGDYAHVRSGVADRLLAAQAVLPAGYRLLVIEGYRPLSLQVRYFQAHVAKLRAAHPTLPERTLEVLASRYISPPEVAAHVAGAAVDLTLCAEEGSELWLGSAINDTDTALCHTAADVRGEAGSLRRILGAALRSAGLVNYPTEWWHWSYGDRYWAHLTGAPCAIYAPLPACTTVSEGPAE